PAGFCGNSWACPARGCRGRPPNGSNLSRQDAESAARGPLSLHLAWQSLSIGNESGAPKLFSVRGPDPAQALHWSRHGRELGKSCRPSRLDECTGEIPMGSMDFRTEQRQQQTLSPRLQHAVRLLQLSSLEFAQQVHDALGKNPFLEEDTDAEEGAAEAAPASE